MHTFRLTSTFPISWILLICHFHRKVWTSSFLWRDLNSSYDGIFYSVLRVIPYSAYSLIIWISKIFFFYFIHVQSLSSFSTVSHFKITELISIYSSFALLPLKIIFKILFHKMFYCLMLKGSNMLYQISL